MSTNASNSSSYLSVAEFLKRADKRTVRQLVSDTEAMVSEASLTTDANLAAALLDASGEVESYALQGERYTAADLAGLTGVSQGKLYRLIAQLTICFLYDRRPDTTVPEPRFYKRTMEQLELLRQGVTIFGYQEVMDAGKIDHVTDTRRTVDEERRMLTSEATRLFGLRMVRRTQP